MARKKQSAASRRYDCIPGRLLTSIMTMDADRIRYLPILRTIVGGHEIYAAN
jgi:hypothetical protein